MKYEIPKGAKHLFVYGNDTSVIFVDENTQIVEHEKPVKVKPPKKK